MQDGKHIHRSVECLDLGRGAWAQLSAQLPSERKYHSVCELGGTVRILTSVLHISSSP